MNVSLTGRDKNSVEPKTQAVAAGHRDTIGPDADFRRQDDRLRDGAAEQLDIERAFVGVIIQRMNGAAEVAAAAASSWTVTLLIVPR